MGVLHARMAWGDPLHLRVVAPRPQDRYVSAPMVCTLILVCSTIAFNNIHREYFIVTLKSRKFISAVVSAAVGATGEGVVGGGGGWGRRFYYVICGKDHVTFLGREVMNIHIYIIDKRIKVFSSA